MADTQDGPRVHKLHSGCNVTTFPLPPRGMRLTDASPAELAQHGLPPRPDRDIHPALHALWLKNFDRKLNFHHPTIRRNPEHTPSAPTAFGHRRVQELVRRGSHCACPAAHRRRGCRRMERSLSPERRRRSRLLHDLGQIDGDSSISVNLGNNLVQAGTLLTVDSSGNLTWLAFWEWLAQGLEINSPDMGIFNMPVQIGAKLLNFDLDHIVYDCERLHDLGFRPFRRDRGDNYVHSSTADSQIDRRLRGMDRRATIRSARQFNHTRQLRIGRVQFCDGRDNWVRGLGARPARDRQL